MIRLLSAETECPPKALFSLYSAPNAQFCSPLLALACIMTMRGVLFGQVGTTSCSESIRSLLTSPVPPTTDQLGHCPSMYDRSPLTVWNSSTASSDSPWSSTSRRNLETILEAIRHLEGDHGPPTNLAGVRRDDVVGQVASNSRSLAEALMASSNVQFTPSKTCVAVRSS